MINKKFIKVLLLIFALFGILGFGVQGLAVQQNIVLASSDSVNYSNQNSSVNFAVAKAKYIILFIGDGQGINHLKATNLYTKSVPEYQSWANYWMTTYPDGGSYDSNLAWSDFNYVKNGATDSAAAATAMFSGTKTANGRINVSPDGLNRYITLSDEARSKGKSVGAITSVGVSDATPGAWLAHNDSRSNVFAIADEALWGNPNTTGSPDINIKYSGGHGSTMPPADVVIGGGNPNWSGESFINQIMRTKLINESGNFGALNFVERIGGSPDGGLRLLQEAKKFSTTRLMGLFGGSEGNLEYRLADGSGYNPENPTLSDMTKAALDVLSKNPKGFVLMVEGGAIDHAAHANNLNEVIGEEIDFNNAIQVVTDRINNQIGKLGSDMTWKNTLVIVTGDHETGYLTAGVNIFPDKPLGEVSDHTLKLEKNISGTVQRASWEDANNNNLIDSGEKVYWAWNSAGHSNSLIPIYAKGVGSNLFLRYVSGRDIVRGVYVDDTSIFKVMDSVLR
jgi:alkaline phosphatase